MNVVLLCETGAKEMDCINVGALLLRLSDGTVVALTEESLRRVGLDKLDATSQMEGWMRERAEQLKASVPPPVVPSQTAKETA